MTLSDRHNSRIKSLDAVRGMAALAVVLHHFGWGFEARVGPHSGYFPRFIYGHFGVELFFILSGFVIARSFRQNKSNIEFVLFRFARLYPAFLVCCGLTLLVLMANVVPEPVPNLSQILIGLTMIGPLMQVAPIDPSHWSLSYEVAFYLLSIFIMRRNTEIACTIWLATALIGTVVLPTYIIRIIVILNLPFTLLFIIGTLLSRLVERQLGWLGAATMATAFGLTSLGPAVGQEDMGRWYYMLLILSFAAIVWAAATRHLRLLERYPLLFLGSISYPLYLIHMIVGHAIIYNLESLGIHSILAVITAFGAVIFLSIIINRFVEMPAQALIRAVLKRKAPGIDHQGPCAETA